MIGGRGATYYADTAGHAAPTGSEWGMLYAVTTTTINNITASDITGSMAGVVLQAGMGIWGRITNIQLTSGSVLMYFA